MGFKISRERQGLLLQSRKWLKDDKAPEKPIETTVESSFTSSLVSGASFLGRKAAKRETKSREVLGNIKIGQSTVLKVYCSGKEASRKRGGKKERLITFTSWVVSHPLIKGSVNNCVIFVSDLTRNSSSLCQKQLLLKCSYLLFRQVVNAVKFIQQLSAKTSQILKTKLALLLLRILPYHCRVIPSFKPSSQTN